MWENLSEQITAILAPAFTDIHTGHQAEHRIDEIAGQARQELNNWLAISETDLRIGYGEAWDRWLERMAEDGYGDAEEQDLSGGWTQEQEDSPCRVEYCIHDPDGTQKWYPIPPPHYQAEQPNRDAALQEWARFRDMYPGMDTNYIRIISLLD